jgi:hypothetical protein
MIADRRETIFREKNTVAIEEMKEILNQYTKEKDEEQKQNGENAEN